MLKDFHALVLRSGDTILEDAAGMAMLAVLLMFALHIPLAS